MPRPIVVFADAADAANLAPLVERARRHSVPLALVFSGDLAGTGVEPAVTVHLQGETLRLDPYGFTAAAQHLDVDLLVGAEALIEQARRARMIARPDDDQATILPGDLPTDPAQVPTEETPEHEIVTELPADEHEITDQADEGDAGVMIRVLGPLELDNAPPDLDEESVAVLAFLAVVGPSTADQIMAAVWPGADVDHSRFDRLVAGLRAALGHRFPEPSDGRYRVRSVHTDLGSARRWLTQAGAMSADRARNLMQLALSEVRGRPFSAVPGRYWQWVADHQMAIETQATSMLIDACFELCDSAYGANDVHLAQWACDVGSLVDPLNETLVTRRVQLLQLQDDGRHAADIVTEWESRYRNAADRPPPGGPRAALETMEVAAPHAG